MSAYKRRRNLTETIGDESVIPDRREGRDHQLNTTAGRHSTACDASRTIDDLTEALLTGINEPSAADRILKDVLARLAEIEQRQLVHGLTRTTTPGMDVERNEDGEA